ncbi:acyltransferase family protein [Rhodococcus sp. NPDC058514]|uniref:acyltransferase family protein n=1 Tax=unclassified Rhodococcus (in: high G+C Gram-positive bacteria) TaxID=192944 RepID=UPI0036569555
MEFAGANLLRAIAVLAVIYSHISYYLIDDLGTGWWLIDGVYAALVKGAGLNQHLSFVGVAIFMTLTGLMLTASATRHTPGRFLFNRIGRLLPALWVAILLAIVLVRLGVNGMFSGQDGISNSEAALSFVLGGFFLTPEVAVLGVTWTLVVQVLFYLYCVAARPLLRSIPIAVPLAGAALCSAVLLYNLYVPQPYAVPMLSKVAATLPAVFMGQIIYLGWARLASWRWLLVATLAQAEVVRLATDSHVYWAGDRYLWTMFVVSCAVLALVRYDGYVGRLPLVRWTATRSYAIYLLHTLILYRVYENAVGYLGTTGAVLAFLLVTAGAAELLYRFVEVPSSRWIGEQSRRLGASGQSTTTATMPTIARTSRPISTAGATD